MRTIALFAVCFGLFAVTAKASVLESRIMAVDVVQGDPEAIVMAEEEGRALRADARDDALIEALSAAAKSGQTLRFDFDAKNGFIKGVMGVVLASGEKNLECSCDKNADTFSSTVLNSLDDAQTAFNSMDRNTKKSSQCFNRAHGWAYDLYRTRGISSNKVFIFFSRQYIKKYKYDWWFHVAPYVLVNVNGQAVEHVLDRSYTKGPREMRTWTNIFMYNDALCPVVTKYTDYRNHQNEQWCFLIKANMYYRSPMDLELLERDGRQETGWNMSEIRTARKQAFKNWRSYNP